MHARAIHSVTRRNRPISLGFSLIELSIVVLVLSIMLGSILTVMNQEMRQAKQDELQYKLAAIEAALIEYRKIYNRLPCPANGTHVSGTGTFGVEAANPGSCVLGSPAANRDDTINTVGGVIPTVTLKLPESYMYDPWGGRFFYAVDKRMTAYNAFNTYTIYNTTIGSITVTDVTGANRTNNAIAVVVSHGANGHGAYNKSGIIKDVGSTNAGEQNNCNCDEAATFTPFDSSFTMQAASVNSSDIMDIFDDHVIFFTRQQLHSASEALTE